MRFIQLFGNFFSSPSPHRVTGALLQLLHSGRPSDALDEILLSPPHQLVPRRRLGGSTDWPQGCLKAGHCIRALHAEQNALLSAAMIGTPCQGSTIYVTCQPCNMCAKMLINAGIERVIYEGDYPDEFSLELFRESGMELYRYVEKSLVKVTL